MDSGRRNSGVAVLGAILLGMLIIGSCLLYGAFWLGTLHHR